MTWFGVLMSMFVVGVVSMGVTMTAMHATAHVGVLRRVKRPMTLGLYGWPHLLHHKEIPHAVPVNSGRPGVVECVRSGALRRDLRWVASNLWNHHRWTPLRIVIVERCVVLFVIGDLVCGWGMAISLVLGYFLGALALMGAYDVWHYWTHTNGPRVSVYHAEHHGRQKVGFGMWWWNNTACTERSFVLRVLIVEVFVGEAVVSRLAFKRWVAWKKLEESEHNNFAAACRDR